MSMVDNFAETLNAIRRFIYANVPAGIDGEKLERLLEGQTHYFPLEFRRDDVSCTLYVELDGFAAASVTDEQGNRWRQYALSAKPSWPSYGSVPTGQAQAFVKLVSEVTDFAVKLMAEFDKPINKMVETAAEAADRKQKAAEENCRANVRSLMRANVKGMRVGQERVVRLPEGAPDMLPVGLVTFDDGVRHYTTHVTATRTLRVTRST